MFEINTKHETLSGKVCRKFSCVVNLIGVKTEAH